MLTRRRFNTLTALGVSSLALSGPAFAKAGAIRLEALPGEIEDRLGVRFGLAILDTETGRRWQHRADERFPLCSTFKVLASGAVLSRVSEGAEDLGRRIPIRQKDLVTYSPVTEKRVGTDMTLGEICEAALTTSDNTAGNLILESLGGPSAVTAFARTLGDATTRLDRWETALNEATPGDPRDTTTPNGMLASIDALLLGEALGANGREQLAAWMVANKTGDAKLRAGLPKGWRIGDKTGGGDHGTMNDIAVIWPPKRKPVLVAVYMTETEASFDDRNAAVADVGRAIGTALKA